MPKITLYTHVANKSHPSIDWSQHSQLTTPLISRRRGLDSWMTDLWTLKCRCLMSVDSLPKSHFIMGTTLPSPWEAEKSLSIWGALWSYGIIFEDSYEVISLVLGRSQLECWTPSWALGFKRKRGQTRDGPKKMQRE